MLDHLVDSKGLCGTIQKDSCQELEFVRMERRPSFQVNGSESGSEAAFSGGQVSVCP